MQYASQNLIPVTLELGLLVHQPVVAGRPGTPGMPAWGMFVQMMEYRHPVAFSQAVRFFACLREGFARRTIHRRPPGHLPARLIRCVTSATCLSFSATCLSFSGLPSWQIPGFQAEAGSILMASSSVISGLRPGVFNV